MKQITCITCPVGCRITIQTVEGKYLFTGDKCNKGSQFALNELTAPMRSLTTTVRTIFPDMPVLSVRTNGEVPKEKVMQIMHNLSKVMITRRTGIGEIIVNNILETGCDIIATSDMFFSANGNQEVIWQSLSY